MTQRKDSTMNSAKSAANYFHDFKFHYHRGVEDASHLLIAFGNDGYNVDERSRKEVELVRAAARKLGLIETDFATDDADGYTWALVYRYPACTSSEPHSYEAQKKSKQGRLGEAVAAAWWEVCGKE